MQNHNKPLILLVDDEKAILDGYILALRREAYEILTAVSPVEALNILGARRVDVVVSDERMPDMLGSDFLRQVRMRWPRVVRILLTGQTDIETTTNAIREGQLYRFLSKPLGPGDLALTIRKALDMQQVLDSHARLRVSGSHVS
jgi:DNA-binding NtrC family response regulator